MRVFDSAQGCHLVRAVEFVEPSAAEFEEVAPNVLLFLEARQDLALLKALETRVLERVRVEWLPLPGERANVSSAPALRQ